MIKVTLDHGASATLESATVAQALQALGVAGDRQVVAARSTELWRIWPSP